MKQVIAITPGEPAGIGPDLCIQLAQHSALENIVIIADPTLLETRAQQLGLTIQLREFNPAQPHCPLKKGELSVYPVSLHTPAESGQLNPENALYVLKTIELAVAGCLKGDFQALVTGPVQKSLINQAGFAFTGHTEYLANLCQQETVVMMLATTDLRVALATTHLPLSEVPAALTKSLLRQVITILHHDLQTKFGLCNPTILVSGLNPHAGESGHLGQEEINIIEPVIAEFTAQGLNLIGPLPADTLFTPKYLDNADAVLAMYHDQGLPVLKYKGFGKAVNITLGLPIIRTSVDHGTALDLAGTGQADTGSLQTAIDTARVMGTHWMIH